MVLDPRFVTSTSLEPLFLDKDTGAPLSGGQVFFWQDTARTIPKLVYELVAPPPYTANPTYAPLPNPITLSSVGTFQDAAGNNIAVYYYPYDANGVLQLYYVSVFNALGVEQFTREAWPYPNILGGGGGGAAGASGANISNELTNPQFANVLFIPTQPLVITLSGAGVTHVNIAPGWTLNITAGGAGTVTVTRNPITGTTAYPFNPPYTLTITPGANIAGLTLTQVLPHNPAIWAPQAGGANGWVATSVLLAPLSSVTINYLVSNGVPARQLLLTQNNLTGAYTEFNNTVQLAPANNNDNADVGFTTIEVVLPPAQATTLSNLQVTGVEANQAVVYEQTTVNRQIDQMFNYYNALLQAKPISSYLIGWDFPYNPAQFLGPTLAASAAGANTSRYVWDQTIVFQTTNSGPAISQGTNGALRVTATNASQFALVQYLSQTDARKILNQRLSVNVSALTSVVAGLGGTISLWYTTGATLPSCGANNSIVATLNAAGKPATFNLAGGIGWTEVPRSNLGDAVFTVGTSATTNFNDYGFSGWDSLGVAGVNTATFFAIVVGFAQLPIGQTIDFNSISLVPGDIPTRPAVKTLDQHYLDCSYYYSKSFEFGVVPATAAGAGNSNSYTISATTTGADNAPSTYYPVQMIGVPTITIYNPVNNNNQIYDTTLGADCNTTHIAQNDARVFTAACARNGGSSNGDVLNFHWTADARLGV